MDLEQQILSQKARKDAEKAQDKALYGGEHVDIQRLAKVQRQQEYAAQLQAQILGNPKGQSSGGGPTSVQMLGAMPGVSSYEDKAVMEKRMRQEEYAKLLKQQELYKLQSKDQAPDLHQQRVEALAAAMARNVSPTNPAGSEWTIGPLGVPVRRTLEVGNRAEQRAFTQMSSPQRMMPPGVKNGFPQNPQFLAPPEPYNMQGQQLPQLFQPYSDFASHAPVYPGGGYPGAGGAIAPVAHAPSSDLHHLGGELQDEREAHKRLLSKQQQLALEEQIRNNKQRMEADQKQQRQYEERMQERLDEERRQLHLQFEAEEKATKIKKEEEDKRALEMQIEAKKRQKEQEELLEKEREAKEEAKRQREMEELRQKELREIQAEQEEQARRMGKQSIEATEATSTTQPDKASSPQKAKLKTTVRAMKALNLFGKRSEVVESTNVAEPELIESHSDQLKLSSESRPSSRAIPPLALNKVGLSQDSAATFITEADDASDQDETPESAVSALSAVAPLLKETMQLRQSISGKELQNQQLIQQLQRETDQARQDLFKMRNEMRQLQRQVSEVSISATDAEKIAKKAEKHSKFYERYERKYGENDESFQEDSSFASEGEDSVNDVFPPREKPPQLVPKPKRVYGKLIPAPKSLATQPEDVEPPMPSALALVGGSKFDGDELGKPDSGLKSDSRFVYPDGAAYKPKPPVVPVRQANWAQQDPMPPSDVLQKKIQEERVIQYTIAAAKAREAAEIAKAEKQTARMSVWGQSPRNANKSNVDETLKAPEFKPNSKLGKAWGYGRGPSSTDADSASEDGDFSLDNVMKNNRNKWAILKDFDDENHDVEALAALVRGLDGKYSRPSSAGSVNSMNSSRNKLQLQRSSTAGSSRPSSEQHRMIRDYSHISANGALARGGQRVLDGGSSYDLY